MTKSILGRKGFIVSHRLIVKEARARVQAGNLETGSKAADARGLSILVRSG